ncbi:probable ADP-ribosylarginine hydrolase Tri1 at N-terminal half [Coccomyxa sp. Obi]|nr:probable ADP-ribosylarginine hydrolase Tri1 at N-terminal half [Coccomyxa sp. Obi]
MRTERKALRIKEYISRLWSSHATGVSSADNLGNFSHEKASLNAAEGAMLGVCVGDAAGAPLEFPRSARISEEKVHQAMQMLGGGVFQAVGPGQGTDDTELMLCLAQSLLTSKPPSLPLDEIAHAYCDWASNGPLDIGSTCEKAFATRFKSCPPQLSQAASCAAIAKQWSSRSETNDALNRVVPLAIWAWRENSSVIAHLAGLEASLSHPSPVVKDCNAAYCIAVAHLLKQPSCAETAFQAALNWAKAEAGPEVVTWLEQAQDVHYCPCVNTRAGWIKWGFLYAFRHLHLSSSFEAAR